MAKKKKSSQKGNEYTPSLETILFNCRDYLRGRAPMTDKRDILLTLVFFKFVDEQLESVSKQVDEKYKDEPQFAMELKESPQTYGAEGVFYIPEKHRWSTIIRLPSNKLAGAFDDAIKYVDEQVEGLKNALPLGIFGSAKLTDNVLKSVVDEVHKINSDVFPEEKDLFGRVYEYFLQAFSINADKEEGEFYTPHSLVALIAALIEPKEGVLYDPCCGSGGMFVQGIHEAVKHGAKKMKITAVGQESEPSTYRLAKMNLAVRQIAFKLGSEPASTFTHDQHPDVQADYIMANPPFNLKKWRGKDELLKDSRWKGFGVPPESNANYAWILHILSKLKKKTGIAGFLLANGALDDGTTLDIRRELIQQDKVEAIMVLPRNMFYSTDISVTLWILNNNKRAGVVNGRKLRDRTGEVLFVDLRTWNENIYEKKFVKLTPEQISKVKEIYHNWQTRPQQQVAYQYPELYASANTIDIEANGWSLVPSRYIEFVDRDTEMDHREALKLIGDKITHLLSEQQENQKRIANALNDLGYEQGKD